MSNIVAFEQAKLPAFLRNRKGANTDLTSHVGAGFPALSIKGKVFTLVKGDERKVIEKEDSDGDMVPARSIEVIIIKANPALSKVYYEAEFEEGSNASPDCSSSDGKVPDASIEKPVSKSCATCPKNVWGSGKKGKGKACSDSRRVAIAPAGQINEPMLLRVPPASLKPLAEYAKMLDNRGVDYDAVVTTLKFDSEEASPKLVFSPRKTDPFLTEEQYEEVQKQKDSEMVGQIIGTVAMPVKEKAEPAAEEDAPAPKKAKKTDVSDDEIDEAVKPAKKAKKVEDDEDEAPAPKKAKKVEDDEDEAPAPKKAKAKVVDDLDEGLDSLLAELDD